MLKLKLFISFALTSLLTMTGCLDNSTGNDSSDLDKTLIGEWELKQTEIGGTKAPATGDAYIFNSDGTFERNIVGNTGQSGTWKTKDGTLYLDDENTTEYSFDYTFKESQLVITQGQTNSYYSKTGETGGGETGGGETGGGETGGGETNPLIGEWELYKIIIEDVIVTKDNSDWEEETIIATPNAMTVLTNGYEESFNYTYNNDTIVSENEEFVQHAYFENSDLVIDYEGVKCYYSKTGETGGGETGGGETGDGETALIGEWELFKIDFMGEILEEDDPDWENLAMTMTITSNKVIWTEGNEKDSSNYTCVDGQIIIEDEDENGMGIPYSFESENVLILDSSYDDFTVKQYYRKL